MVAETERTQNESFNLTPKTSPQERGELTDRLWNRVGPEYPITISFSGYTKEFIIERISCYFGVNAMHVTLVEVKEADLP